MKSGSRQCNDSPHASTVNGKNRQKNSTCWFTVRGTSPSRNEEKLLRLSERLPDHWLPDIFDTQLVSFIRVFNLTPFRQWGTTTICSRLADFNPHHPRVYRFVRTGLDGRVVQDTRGEPSAYRSVMSAQFRYTQHQMPSGSSSMSLERGTWVVNEEFGRGTESTSHSGLRRIEWLWTGRCDNREQTSGMNENRSSRFYERFAFRVARRCEDDALIGTNEKSGFESQHRTEGYSFSIFYFVIPLAQYK